MAQRPRIVTRDEAPPWRRVEQAELGDGKFERHARRRGRRGGKARDFAPFCAAEVAIHCSQLVCIEAQKCEVCFGQSWVRRAKSGEFWDTHDLTGFEGELEDVPEPVFVRGTTIKVPLESRQVEAVEQMAKAKGVSPEELIRAWVLQKLARRHSARPTKHGN